MMQQQPSQQQGKCTVPKAHVSRRSLLGAAGAAGMLAIHRCLGAEAPSEEPRVLQQGDRLELDCTAEEIIEKAYQLGHNYEKEHGGCARCTVAALQDALPCVGPDEGLFRASTCLDGGATPVREQNCGGFTGAGMVIGYLCGSRRNGTFEGSAKLAHQLLHRVYHRFAREYGTVLCRDVRAGADGDCQEVVGRAARWTAEVLLAEFSDYELPAEAYDPPANEADEKAKKTSADGPGNKKRRKPAEKARGNAKQKADSKNEKKPAVPNAQREHRPADASKGAAG